MRRSVMKDVSSGVLFVSFALLMPLSSCRGEEEGTSRHAKSWRSIIPGQTTRQEVVQILGQPDEIQGSVIGLEMYVYRGTSEDPPQLWNAVGFDSSGNVARLVSVPSPAGDDYLYADAVADMGPPERVLFSYNGPGTRTYVFASHGVTLIAYEQGRAISQLYYEPMSITDYMDSYGRHYPSEDPYVD